MPIISNRRPGLTIWFTGLSSAGKTTISRAVGDMLNAKGYAVEILDGDAMRTSLCKDLGFSKTDREENVRRLSIVAELLMRHGVIVLVAAISPYRAGRDEARDRLGRFLEVHVDAPLEVCESRDVKGVYRRARAGQLLHVTGLDDPYETPLEPELVCRSNIETVEECALKVVDAAERVYRPDLPPM